MSAASNAARMVKNLKSLMPAGSHNVRPPARAISTSGQKYLPRLIQNAKEGLLFVNKKKQKNFVNLGLGRVKRPAPNEQKFFGSFF
jgi:hypothetical protein